MPYDNVPEHLWGKMDECVRAVMSDQGVDKETAVAICYKSVVEANGGHLAEAPDYAGHAMVALYPPPETAAALALDAAQFPDRIAPEDLHVTLVYLGEIDQIEASKEDVMKGLAEIASGQPILQARINGAGRFADVGEIGQTAFYANVDCKEMPSFRELLVGELEWRDAKSPSQHGFTPHITLAYLPTDAPTPAYLPVDDVMFDSVCLVWGDERISFRLQGEVGTPAPAEEPVQVQASERELSDVWDRSLTEASIDEQGNLSGIIVVEGLSANGNDYTPEALESGVEIFAGRPIYADHPTRTEERERPERSVRDLVGRLPDAGGLCVEPVSETDGRLALKYSGGKLSETAGWLATLIREGIAGDQSINAHGRGREQDGKFVIEAFTAATSLDFVTKAAAGGKAFLESQRTPNEDVLSSLTFAQLVEARPDIVNDVAQRERAKAYGEKRELFNLREVYRMSKTKLDALRAENARLKAALAQRQRAARKQRADQIINEAVSNQPAPVAQRVRRLVESAVHRFVEQEPGELAPASPDLQPGDPPKVELPPDAAMLPEEAQAIFLETYTAHIGEGEDMATHKAWAAVAAAGWVKDPESGEWSRMEPEDVANAVADEMAGDGEQPEGEREGGSETATEEALRRTIAEAVKSERAYMAQISGAGRVSGMGAGSEDLNESQREEKENERLIEAFKKAGLTEAEAQIAVEGR